MIFVNFVYSNFLYNMFIYYIFDINITFIFVIKLFDYLYFVRVNNRLYNIRYKIDLTIYFFEFFD